jgi:hypothetical protein
MKSKAITLILVSVLLASTAFGGYAELKKYPIGTLHGASACTVNLYGLLYGTSYARFTLRGDTLVDTVMYYQADVQVQPIPSAGWTTIKLVSDSVTLNSEGSTKFVTDTLEVPNKYVQLITTYAYRSRFLLTPTALVAKQGVKDCTLWVTTYKD